MAEEQEVESAGTSRTFSSFSFLSLSPVALLPPPSPSFPLLSLSFLLFSFSSPIFSSFLSFFLTLIKCLWLMRSYASGYASPIHLWKKSEGIALDLRGLGDQVNVSNRCGSLVSHK